MEVKGTRRRKWRVRSLGLTVALSFVLSSAWAGAAKVDFNIPAGELSEAVLAFSDQTHIDIMYAYLGSQSAEGIKTRAVVGRFEPGAALARMLRGTGFTFEFENAASVLLKDKRAPAGSAEDASFAAAQRAAIPEPKIELITVTGSSIRGMNAITAPLIVVGKKEKKQAAYGTVQDVLRTLPLNFGGGSNEDFSTNQNFTRGSGINLRGLGTGATLVLINGRRQPASGIGGDFVDVSTIPWSAVERIEVLADGGSALYGSDAVAGVVNVIMREDLPGVGEIQARMGAAPGGADEKLLAQSFGHRWDSGKWLLTYQYSERTSLAAAERRYAANADKSPLGGSDLRSVSSNPGNILDPATQLPAFAIPNGQDGRSLDSDQLLSGVTNFYNQMAERDLLPNRQSHSAFFTASQKLGERFDLFAEARYNQREISATERAYTLVFAVPASNPFFVDPFGGSPYVVVAYNFLNDFGPIREKGETTTYTGALGIKASLSDNWQATFSGYAGREEMNWRGSNLVDFEALAITLADSDRNTAFNPFGSGSNTSPATLEAIRYTQLERAASDIKTISFVADGPLPELRAGTPKLAVGFDLRRESLFRYNSQGQNTALSAQYAREVAAAFGELSFPLASRLNLSLAARYETYSDFGDTFNPKIGLRWSASDAVRLRASWSTSFRAPTLVDLYDKSLDAAVLFPLADPQSVSGFSLVLLEQGNNPGLHEETARTWTAGIDFAPTTVPGLTLSSTYYSIDYGDRVFRIPPNMTLQTLLADERWSPLVTRSPSRSEIERICQSLTFLGSPADCLASSPAALLDVRLRNLSATTVKGIDAGLKQALQTHFGSFDLGVNGSYVLNFEERVTRNAPAADLAGVVLNAPKLRFRATAEWHRHGRDQPGWGASLATDYFSHFRDDVSPLVTRVDASATLDAQLSYRTAESTFWLGDTELMLNAVNVFNQNPPLIDREQGYDPANAKPYGRVISLTIQKSW